MHIATVTTTTPEGQILNHQSITTPGTDTDALHHAHHLAAQASLTIHAADPWCHHAHLITLNDEPTSIFAPRTTPSGRTDLLATLHAVTRT